MRRHMSIIALNLPRKFLSHMYDEGGEQQLGGRGAGLERG